MLCLHVSWEQAEALSAHLIVYEILLPKFEVCTP